MFKFITRIILIAAIAIMAADCLKAGNQEDYDDINRFLQWADMEQFLPAVKKNKAAVNFNNGAIIIDYANYLVDPAYLKILLDAGANPNAKQENTNANALHIILAACTEDNAATVLEAAKLLVAKGCDVNHQESQYGYTPLHVAARNEAVSKEIFAVLLSAKNVNVNIKCNTVNQFQDGAWPPLFFVVMRVNDNQGTNKDIVKMFIDKKADLKMTVIDDEVCERRKFTLLHICAETGFDHVDICQVLVEAGMEIDAMAPYSMFTPLHVAMLSNNPKISKYLLEKGADYLSKNKDGVTILDHSLAFGKNRNFESADVIIEWAKTHPK